jgi:hypothetical protein
MRANLTQLNTNSGILLDSINLDMYMVIKSQMGVHTIFTNPTTYIIFNGINELIFAGSINE